MAWSFPKLTRRTFLKGSVATGLAGVATGHIATAGLPSWSDLKFAAKRRGEMKEQISFTICNFCSGLCNVEVRTLTDGQQSRIVKLEHSFARSPS